MYTRVYTRIVLDLLCSAFGSPDKRMNPFAPAQLGGIEWRAYADSPLDADVEDGGSVFTL